jgi:uncharacterized protein (TIGR00369 family)
MKTPTTKAIPFEPEFIEYLTHMFEEKIPFNQVLGLKIDKLEAEGVAAHIDMQPQLVGHFTYNRLHGGVISAALDAMAGLAVMAAMGARHMDEPPAQKLQRFGRLGTIDLRVDYLRAAIATRFDLQAQVLRLGSRVATARMEFHAAGGELLATGSAAYIVS